MKVIDDEERLRSTLAHEMCHAAQWLLDGAKNPPHGEAFRRWGRAFEASVPGMKVPHARTHARVCPHTSARHARSTHAHRAHPPACAHAPRMRAHGSEHGHWDVAQVTTCHSYEIFAKYRFGCSTCGHEFARHSKSLDLTRKGCGVCRGKLSFLGAFNRDGTPVKAREPTAFAKYVGEHFSALKKARPVASHKELMGELGTRFREARAGGDGGGDGGGSHAPLSNAFECIEVDSDGGGGDALGDHLAALQLN